MKYTVYIGNSAQGELDAAYDWLIEQTPQHGPTWYNDLVDAINSLEDNPDRFPIAPGSEAVSRSIRQMLHGSKRHAYRVLFTIRNESVIVLHVMHAARDIQY